MSRFTIGQEIKAFCQCGLQRCEQWNRGTVVKMTGSKVVVDMPDKEHTLSYGKVRRWDRLAKGVLDKFAENNFAELVSYVQKGVKALCPNLSVEIDEAEKIVHLDNKMVSIQAEVREGRSIAAFFEYPTWGISSWHSIPATQWEPPDVSEVEQGECRDNIGAAALAINTCWKLKAEDFWQCEGENRMFDEMDAAEQLGEIMKQ